MFKDVHCQYHKRCKLQRECEGCKVPAAASEYDLEQPMKIQYSEDKDRRGLDIRKEIYGTLVDNKEKFYDEHGEEEEVLD
jgi:hypothetical protein